MTLRAPNLKISSELPRLQPPKMKTSGPKAALQKLFTVPSALVSLNSASFRGSLVASFSPTISVILRIDNLDGIRVNDHILFADAQEAADRYDIAFDVTVAHHYILNLADASTAISILQRQDSGYY